MPQSTPADITGKILELCDSIAPSSRPVFLDIRPEPGCEAADCFNCVQRKATREGGRVQYGWAIWEWPRVFVEAEHHAVFDPGSGRPWIDLTPCPNGSLRRLFLPDDAATYDFEDEGFRRDNVRLALSDDPDIQTLFKAAERRTRFWNEIPGVGMVSLSPAEDRQRQKLERAVANAVAALEEKYS